MAQDLYSDDVGATAAFLLSPLARAVTGALAPHIPRLSLSLSRSLSLCFLFLYLFPLLFLPPFLFTFSPLFPS